MTAQYGPEDINYGSEAAFVECTTLNATEQGAVDTTVLRMDNVTNSSANAYTVTTTANEGTTVTVLQPGVYVATLITSVNGAHAAAISLGGTAPPFNTDPAAMGGNDGIISLADNVTANQSVLCQSISFRLTPAQIDGTQNVLRFLSDAGLTFIDTQFKMRVDRIVASGN